MQSGRNRGASIGSLIGRSAFEVKEHFPISGMSFMIYSWRIRSGNNNDKTTMQQTGDISSPCVGLYFTESTSRTHYILKELRDVGLAGRKVDFLYDSLRTCISSV